MKVKYAVTYEFDNNQPVTHRGEVEAGSEATCSARAIKAAKKALKPHSWTSMVCVILERSK